MKNKLLIFFVLISSAVAGQSVYSYEVNKVREDIYVLEPRINDYRWVTSNIIVIVNERDVVVVDSGLLPAAAIEAIKEIRKITSKPVSYLINTHWHGDHWQGNEAFVAAYPDIEIVASAEGRNGIMRNGMVWVRQFYNKYLQLMVDDYDAAVRNGNFKDGKKLTDAEMKTLKEGLAQVKADMEGIKGLHPTFPTMSFDKQMSIVRGGREIRLLQLGWGNTTGDAVVYLPNEKVLIPGDLVVSPSPYESGSFSKEWLETSRRLAAIPFDFLIPGHGSVQKDGSYLEYLNALFAEVIRQMNASYISGKNTIDEANLLVNHNSVVAELSKEERFKKYLKDLDPAFVPACIRSAYQKAKEGKL